MRHLFAPLGLVLLLGTALLFPGCGAAGAAQDQFGGGTGDDPPPASGSMSPGELAYAQQVLDLVNAERANAGVGPVVWDEPATDVAYAHSVDMDVRNFFSHTNPDGLGPGDRINAAGIRWTAWGENIARGQDSPGAVMSGWMASPGHRDNILNANFTHLGVGVHSASGGPWWTQVFLRR